MPGGPDVVQQLRDRLPNGWRATLLAVDGAVTDSVARQLARIPADATSLVISAGGNDALGEAYLLDQPARSVGEAVGRLADAQARFAQRYAAIIKTVLTTRMDRCGVGSYGSFLRVPPTA